MTNNPKQQDETEFDIVEDDDAPLKTKTDAKPKRKPKSQSVPWRWVIPAFFIGLGIAALLLFGVLIAGVSRPVTSVVERVVTATPMTFIPTFTPIPPLPTPIPPPFPATTSPGLAPAPIFGGRIEDIVWHGDEMIVARSNPARMDVYNYDSMNYLGEIKPFNFANEGFDKYVSLAVDPSGQYLASINTNYMFSSGDILAEADLAWYTLNGQGGEMNYWLKTHSAAALNNGNPAIPHLDAAVAFAPNGSLMATGAGGAAKGNGNLYLWDTSNGAIAGGGYISDFYASAMGTVALAFTEDSRHLTAIIRSDDGDDRMNCMDCGSVMVFDVSDPQNPFPLWEIQQAPHFNLDAAKLADMSENGRYLAIPQMEDDRVVTGIEIWELPSMHQLGVIALDADTRVSQIRDLDLSDDGRTVAFIHRTGTGQRYADSNEPLIEQLNLYSTDWTLTEETPFAYETRQLAELDPIYSVGFFLHVSRTANYIYYIDPLYGVLNRIHLSTGERTQMMQL